MRVGRTMYTTDKIPKDWISEIKRRFFVVVVVIVVTTVMLLLLFF